MKKSFKFYPIESKIYDYLFLPNMIYCDEDENEKNNFKEEISEDFKKLWYSVNSRLKPYEKILSKYYFEEFSFIFLLASKHSFFNFPNVKGYLDYLLTLDDGEIIETIIYTLQLKELDQSHSEEAMNLAETLSKDDAKLMAWINGLKYSGEAKWQLLCFSKAPKMSLAECIQTLRTLEPIFTEFYSPNEQAVMNYGEEFISRLNSFDGDALSQVTNSIVKDAAISGDTKRFVVSYFNGYTVQINASSIPSYVAWGFNIENFFRMLLQRSENQLAERILLFKNLGDKTRYEVLKCIAKGITSTNVIAKQLGVSSATISYHLNNLATSKLITLLQQDGRYYYAVNHDFIEQCCSDLKKDLH
jgi:DNA-binding transcriptional ArsR family regulator